ncbi:deleted in malignant brain tumors 1 protein-like [Saccostrea echinata]|uniref:deleted in malignant brain tumors 1 protein-like n=1 Tax=Saccostrea echinata TaxID=191078 RepID=UPI002A7FA3CE|nr:deleted in malignant brain tumors 1 protein-like [Saccostrea echinata]
MSVNGQSVLDGSKLLDKCPLANIEEVELLINSAAQRVIMSHLHNMDSRFTQYRIDMNDLKKMLQDNQGKNNMEIKLLKGKIQEQQDLIKNLHKNVEAEAVKQGARLVNGSSFREGRVEVYKDGVWGTVCDDNWDYKDANVICRQLFGLVGSPYSNAHFGHGVGIIQMDDVGCYGYESSLMHCTHTDHLSHNCGHSEDAGVVCIKAPPIRLSRQLEFQGRVEVYKNNEWGTVCDDDWDHVNAGVICRSLGYSEHGLAVSNAVFGEGSGSILFDDVQCNGRETGLSECTFSSTNNCNHREDAGVICRLQGDHIRLSKGTSVNEGILEVLINRKWGAVCDRNWDQSDTKVACRSLGYSSYASLALTDQPRGSSRLLIKVECTGREESLNECAFGLGNCNGTSPLVLECSADVRRFIRLVDGSSSNEGRVEVFINGEWGTVCDDMWWVTHATVVCKSLGYSGKAYFGAGTGRIWLDNVNCDGSEASIFDCRHRGYGKEDCTHYEDAGVTCS